MCLCVCCIVQDCSCVACVRMCLCQWYSPGRKVTKKKCFCLCMCVRTCVHGLFIRVWAGDMINMHTRAHNVLAYSRDLAAFAKLRPPPPCSS